MLGYVPLFLFFANICLIGSKNYRVCFNTLQQKKRKLETFLISFNFIMLKVNSSCVSYTTNNTDACVQIAIARYVVYPLLLSPHGFTVLKCFILQRTSHARSIAVSGSWLWFSLTNSFSCFSRGIHALMIGLTTWARLLFYAVLMTAGLYLTSEGN